jgi:glycosyltransferase involved in cell wall biosynthesis
VEDGMTGWLVPSRDPGAMAAAIQRLTDPQLRRQMGLAGRKRIMSRFSYAQCLMNYDELYRSLLSGKGIPPSLKPR